MDDYTETKNHLTFEEWFAKSGYQESEKNHLQNAYNYALADGFKKGLEYFKEIK